MNIQVWAISNIEKDLEYISDDLGETGFIALTTNKYDIFEYISPHIIIHCLDVDKDEVGFITNIQIKELYKFLKRYWYLDSIIVMCDAGLSRSPATAIALYEYFGESFKANRFKEIHKFYNEDMYRIILDELNELKKGDKKI
jgi:hypothetical protein